MCTVVVDWQPGRVGRILALRDELVGREFDDPDTWWPEQPTVVGGRDRVAGGSWCVSDVATGRTALVLNRPERRVAAEGAPSRGVLPLAAVAAGEHWVDHVDCTGMASFALLTVDEQSLRLDEYDGARLSRSVLAPGTHVVTSGGAEDGKASRHQPAFASAGEDQTWLELVHQSEPSPDLTDLVVRIEHEQFIYATVFGQLIHARPGRLELLWSRRPWLPEGWQQCVWPGPALALSPQS